MQVDPRAVEAARKGDTRALDTLIQAVWPVAYRTAFAILHERAAAEDAAQDACALMCAKLPRLRDAAAFPAWFGRVSSSVALRAAQRTARDARLGPVLPAAPDACASLAETIDLQRAIAALPLSLRVPLVLHYVQGLSGEDIARSLHLPHGTVRYRLSTARRRLSDLLGRPAGEPVRPSPALGTPLLQAQERFV